MPHDERNLPVTVKDARHEYYRSIFDTYDTDGSGYIELKKLRDTLRDNDEVPRKIVKKVYNYMSDSDNNGKINYHEFIGMIHNRHFKELFGHCVNIYIRFILPHHYHLVLSANVPTRYDKTEGLYEDQYSCCPPPIAMLIISVIQFTCFLIDEKTEQNSTETGTGATANIFIYNPYKRFECWRYFTYMFVHIGYLHLVVNLSVQILLGVPLEMINKWWRVLLVYFAGVLAGSLAMSMTNPSSYLAGASAGVYALITAHVASMIMNWNEMSFPVVQIIIFIIIFLTDVGPSIYNRYWLGDNISFSARFAGGMAGLLVGMWILKNFVPTTKDKYIWWFAPVIFIILVGVMIVLNIIWAEHFLPVRVVWRIAVI